MSKIRMELRIILDYVSMAIRNRDVDAALRLIDSIKRGLDEEDANSSKAIEVIKRFGGTQESHHMKWVIDQVLRKLMTKEEYEAFKADTINEGYDWDEGTAP